MNRKILSLVCLLIFKSILFSTAQPLTGLTSGEIRQSLQKLGTLGCVMYIAAHPDDENTRLLAFLANEKNLRTVYLSITRGDGGQNLIGKEQGEELGMVRTQELLMARKIDHAEQQFTRANDFGFSKSFEESFNFWDKETILSDVVFAIRKYQPDVIINRFPPTVDAGHGHHTASALLAIEAFKAAADPLRFPEQLQYVDTWKARRIFQNSFTPRGQPVPDMTGQLQLDVGGYNTFLGSSYGELAAASRSMHKSQGFGVAVNRGKNIEYFKKLDGDTAVKDIFEGINTSWSREAVGSQLPVTIRRVYAEFNDEHPEKSIPLLIDIRNQIEKLDDGYWKKVKEKEVTRLLAACSGLWAEVNSRSYYGVPGDSFSFTFSMIARTYPGVVLEKIKILNWDSLPKTKLPVNEMVSFSKNMLLSKNLSYSNPYWLNKPHGMGTYKVDSTLMTGQPWNHPEPEATVELSVDGTRISFQIPVINKWTDPVKGERYRPYEIIPAVSINPSESILLFPSGEKKSFRVEVQSFVANITGEIKINAPKGWLVEPASSKITLKGIESKAYADFSISHTGGSTDTSITGSLVQITFEANGTSYDQRISRIRYDHIPQLVHLKKSTIKLVPVNLITKARKIGYIDGAGDEVAKCLTEAGFEVTILDEQKILNEPLGQYEAIVTGVRAYNTIENIAAYYEPLMRYVESGGNLVVQYNTNNFISTINSTIGPYPFKISRDRVTVEEAPVQFDDPNHFLLNTPNKITQDDFKGWVQERGLYFATELSPEYKTIISMNDPGEKPLAGSLVIAQKGKGYFIYTGLAFFRQLPAGVPGAYRLFVNLLNAGK